MNTGAKIVPSKNRLLTIAALGPAGEPAYALEGSVFIAGAAVQWLRDGLGLLKRAADSYAQARASVAKNRDRTQPYVVPAFVGLGSPYWDANAKGAILGITRGTSSADIVRATLDSIAYQVRDVIVAMESDTGQSMSELRADGGATENRYLMQFQADILGKPVRRAKVAETTAMGAAMLAGLALGIWKSPAQLHALLKGSYLFKPSMKAGERERLLAGWHDAVSRVLTSQTK
jgi:glycerol kinase